MMVIESSFFEKNPVKPPESLTDDPLIKIYVGIA